MCFITPDRWGGGDPACCWWLDQVGTLVSWSLPGGWGLLTCQNGKACQTMVLHHWEHPLPTSTTTAATTTTTSTTTTTTTHHPPPPPPPLAGPPLLTRALATTSNQPTKPTNIIQASHQETSIPPLPLLVTDNEHHQSTAFKYTCPTLQTPGV